ncbi:MAG: LLM class flavin-dependent oxidoreductase, partial [Dehalococcoidia bacterium]
GARTNEFLRVMKALWTQDHPDFRGRFYTVGDVAFYPKPLQKPYIPLWIGGEAMGSLRRAAMLGDSYHAVDFGHEPFGNLVERYQRVQELTKEYGRDPDSVSFSLRTLVNFASEDVASVIRRFQAYQEAGAVHTMIDFRSRSPEEAKESVRRFAHEVRPALAG